MTTEAAPSGRSSRAARSVTSPRGGAFAVRRFVSGALKHIGVTALSVGMIYPLIWLVVASLRPDSLIFREPGIVLSQLSLDNYEFGWTALSHPFSRYLLNTLVLVGGAILGNLVSCSLAAYAFARLRFTGRAVLFAIMLMTIMLPFHVVVVPQYILFAKLGWVNSFLPLIVPKFLAVDAFFVFLMVQFIRSIPRELDQAAEVDGCNPIQIYVRVIFPLLRPAIITTAAFTFIWTYDDFFSQLIYLADSQNYTVPLGLRMFLNAMGESSYGSLFAMSVLTIVPVFCLFVLFQRKLVEGISTTGLKG